jgi:uncharacterized protein
MGEPRDFRDPIHDFISLNGEEVDIVNIQAFQRLRGIKQLALANLVYPGALHTRFEHSLAVSHIANLMAIALGLNEDNKRLVRLASLLHDIGHGPFSHVSENLLELFADTKKIAASGSNKEKIHELITADIIRRDIELKKLIGESKCDNVASLILHGYDEPILKSIVSGPLDADKQDYLLRDSHYCGVKYGIFDIFQLHRELRSVTDPSIKLKQLMISQDGVHAVEQFILAKYHISNQVYRHRVRLITDQMITRGIRLGIEVDNIVDLIDLYTYDGSDSFIENYKKWDDSRVFHLALDEKYLEKSYFGRMFHRLKARNLYKRIFNLKVIELNEKSRDLVTKIMNPSYKVKRDEIEGGISEIIAEVLSTKMDSREVVLYSFNINSVRGQKNDSDESILVERDPNPIPFENESVLFKSINSMTMDSFVEIYAPVYYSTPAEREEKLRKLKTPILDYLNQINV